jgi:uncharacterized protein YbjT (DUF2867 family)
LRVLVVGAGGRFSPAADLLIERGHEVRVSSREPGSSAAGRLAALGGEIVTADYEEAGSLATAARDVDAVFAGGTAHHVGPDGEERHGRNLARAASAAGVPHLVYVSGDGAAPGTTLPLFHAKWNVEQAIAATGVPHTILRPTYLMENLFNPWNIPALQAGVYPSPTTVDRPLQQTAIADLLAVATLAIEQSDRFTGQRIPVASDELTAKQAAESISSLIPRRLEARRAPVEELPPGVGFLFGWLESTGHHVDIDSLHDEFPEVGWRDYGAWAEEQLDRFREICPEPEPVAH